MVSHTRNVWLTFPHQSYLSLSTAQVLVSCFLRPFKMAASSKRPPLSHEDVNSIFLNSETVLFLHQIFLKGLTSRLESWPTLVLGKTISMYTELRLSIQQNSNVIYFSMCVESDIFFEKKKSWKLQKKKLFSLDKFSLPPLRLILASFSLFHQKKLRSSLTLDKNLRLMPLSPSSPFSCLSPPKKHLLID